MMGKYPAIIFCMLFVVTTCKNQNNSNSSKKITHYIHCPDGKALEQERLKQGYNSCDNCLFCGNNSIHTYMFVVCPSRKQLNTCTHELFLKNWQWQPNFMEKVKNDSKHVPHEKRMVATTEPNESTLISEHHVPLPLAITIYVVPFVILGIAIVFLFVFLFRKKLKKHQTSYDAISSRRRRYQEDENYVRYTKDPTSLHKDRVRASWPRAARSDHRNLLEMTNQETDTASNNREVNHDSNSAQYVYIQTFSAGANPSVIISPTEV